MQYIVKLLYEQNKEILGFTSDFEKFKQVSDVNLEEIITETNNMKNDFEVLG